MRILHLSDTHGYHRRLGKQPEADVIVHSGDFCGVGSDDETIDFLEWFSSLRFAHKIFIAGNHDDILYKANIEGLDSNMHYLCNSGVESCGVKFYEIPMFIQDSLTQQQASYYSMIPNDTDILVTHTPPFGILDIADDINYGSGQLLRSISLLPLKAHLFGHVHSQFGQEILNGTVPTALYSPINITPHCELRIH